MMNTTTFVLTFAVLVLAALLVCCRKSTEGLRTKAREEAQAKHEKACEEARQRAEVERFELFKKDLWQAIQHAVDNPDMYKRNTGHGFPAMRHPAPVLERMSQLLNRHSFDARSELIKNLETRVQNQASTIREMKYHLKQIHEALQLGAPVEPKL